MDGDAKEPSAVEQMSYRLSRRDPLKHEGGIGPVNGVYAAISDRLDDMGKDSLLMFLHVGFMLGMAHDYSLQYLCKTMPELFAEWTERGYASVFQAGADELEKRARAALSAAKE